MPRTALPLTPASSTEIPGKDGAKQLASLQTMFELPPPAMSAATAAATIAPRTSTTSTEGARPIVPSPVSPLLKDTPSSAYPMQASETVKARRRTSNAQAQAQAVAASTTSGSKDAFALPPPPTRSRKIIQMKPHRPQEDELPGQPEASSFTSVNKPTHSRKLSSIGSVASISATETAPTSSRSSKRKQPSSTSAAGRKMARKTAHSLIERRRRSKMNEEFAVLKDMIPACTGEMHKLAILQASIEYVRYLKDCVSRLQAQRGTDPTNLLTPSTSYPPYRPFQPSSTYYSPDVEMTGGNNTPSSTSSSPVAAASPTFTSPPSAVPTPQLDPRSQQPSVSPALLPRDSSHHSLNSYASSTTSDQRHYSFGHSALTSPALGPQMPPLHHHHYSQRTQHHQHQQHQSHPHSHAAAARTTYSTYSNSNPGSTFTSPSLGPQADRDRDLDQEATAALLMLTNDRRGIGSVSAGSSSGGSGAGAGVMGSAAAAGASAAGIAGRGMSVRDLLSS